MNLDRLSNIFFNLTINNLKTGLYPNGKHNSLNNIHCQSLRSLVYSSISVNSDSSSYKEAYPCRFIWWGQTINASGWRPVFWSDNSLIASYEYNSRFSDRWPSSGSIYEVILMNKTYTRFPVEKSQRANACSNEQKNLIGCEECTRCLLF